MLRKTDPRWWLALTLPLGAPGVLQADDLPAAAVLTDPTVASPQTPPAVSSLPRLRWSDTGQVSLTSADGEVPFSSPSLTLAAAKRLSSPVFLSAPPGEGVGAGNEPFNLFAAPEIRLGAGSLKLPLTHREYRDDEQRAHRFNALGVEWEQELLPGHRLALSAERGGHVALDESGLDTSRTRAALRVSSELPALNGAQVSGTVFLGGETPRDEVYKHLGRRFYGFSLEGRFTAFRHHSPYTSFQVQRSDYDTADPAAASARWEDYSRLAAGWDWQIMPNWGLRAEANYSLNTSNESAYEYDRSELFFSTRFNFR